jgi:hypothetical protein
MLLMLIKSVNLWQRRQTNNTAGVGQRCAALRSNGRLHFRSAL